MKDLVKRMVERKRKNHLSDLEMHINEKYKKEMERMKKALRFYQCDCKGICPEHDKHEGICGHTARVALGWKQ